MVSIVTSFATLRIDWLLPNAREQNDKWQMLLTGVTSLLAVVSLLLLICILAMIGIFSRAVNGGPAEVREACP